MLPFWFRLCPLFFHIWLHFDLVYAPFLWSMTLWPHFSYDSSLLIIWPPLFLDPMTFYDLMTSFLRPPCLLFFCSLIQVILTCDSLAQHLSLCIIFYCSLHSRTESCAQMCWFIPIILLFSSQPHWVMCSVVLIRLSHFLHLSPTLLWWLTLAQPLLFSINNPPLSPFMGEELFPILLPSPFLTPHSLSLLPISLFYPFVYTVLDGSPLLVHITSIIHIDCDCVYQSQRSYSILIGDRITRTSNRD